MEQKMNNRSIGKKAFIIFFAIVILLSAVVETLICRGGPEWLYLALYRFNVDTCRGSYRGKLRFLPGKR